MGYIPPSITDDIIEFLEHYGMTVFKTTWFAEAGEFKLTVESRNPMKWDSVISMIEFEFGVSVYTTRDGYDDEYTVTLAIYP